MKHSERKAPDRVPADRGLDHGRVIPDDILGEEGEEPRQFPGVRCGENLKRDG